MSYDELITLIPGHSLEDFPTELGEEPASSLLSAFSAMWHPVLIAKAECLPTWHRADEAVEVRPSRIVIVPTACQDFVPRGWSDRARREGMHVISGISQRDEMVEALLEPFDVPQELDPELVADFLAFGTAHLQTELLTRHMRNFSQIDEVHLQREIVAAARAALSHDKTAAETHLKYCFEMLLECRERFYPVDCHLLDVCLMLPSMASQLAEVMESGAPVNLLGPIRDWDEIAKEQPDLLEKIRARVEDESAEILGGDWCETTGPLLALDSTVWQLQTGRGRARELFGKEPKTWARRRFGVGGHMPQLLSRFGYLGALHIVMDDGLYPDEEQTLLRWEGADGSALDAFSRIPLAGDSASSFLRFPLRMSESMDYDQTAGVCFARWPEMRTPWLNDLRRGARYAPALGKFSTFANFFHNSDMTGRVADFKSGDYLTPFLLQSVAKREADPIGRYLDYWKQRRRFDRVAWLHDVATLLGAASDPAHADLESLVEAADPEAGEEARTAASAALDSAEESAAATWKQLLCTSGGSGKGLLVLNPHSFERTIPIRWPDGTIPGKEPAVSHRQIDEQRRYGLVTIPPCGFAWVGAGSDSESDYTSAGKIPMAEELVVRNDFFEVQLSDVTGGIAQVRTYKRSPNRISQQLAFRFPHERTVTTESEGGTESYRSYYSEMRLVSSQVLSSGPLFGAVETTGEIFDPAADRVLATYRQEVRVWRNRPVIELDLELEPDRLPEGDPWTNYYGCRFAWKQESAALTASQQQGAQAVVGKRIEAPQYIEIADDRFRTTILTPGQPFHRMTGERMLDSLLIVEGESRRKFSFAIAVDSVYPMQSAVDAFSPPLVVPTENAPPPEGMSGWLFHVDARNVTLTRVTPRPGSNSSCVVRLLETEGRRKTLQLRCFKQPQSARQIDFQGETVNSFPVQGDAVEVDISPFEMCDVEVTF